MPCPLDIGPSSWYVESLTRRRRDARLHESLARTVLPRAGALKSPGGIGTGIQRNQSEVRPARPGDPAAAGGSGERTAGGNLPDLLHRRLSAGHGDCRGAGALLLRGRG